MTNAGGRIFIMSIRYTKYVVAIAVAAIAVVWAGCSSGSNSSYEPSSTTESQVEFYFPLDPGYSVVYSVTSGGVTQQETYTIGTTLKIGSADAVRWIVRNGAGNLDTSFLVSTDSALYFLETAASEPEKILSLPLTSGNSWPRYNNYDVTGYTTYTNLGTGTNSGGLGGTLGGKDTTGNGGMAAKNYPSTGANTFTVVDVNTVDVDGLGTLAGAVKLSNIGYNGTMNYYWFVPGLGLVKYMIGTTAGGTGASQVVGQMQTHN
jgi:hypothetical protein